MAGASSETGHLNIGAAETSSHPKIKLESAAMEATGDFDEVSETRVTKKLKSLAPKCTDEGLRKAAKDSPWYCALKSQDCHELMALLQANPCLVAQTGPEGLTILHAAAKRGCIQLLYQVLNIFDNHQFVDEVLGCRMNLYLNDLHIAKCGVYSALAMDMAWFTCSKEDQEVFNIIYRCSGREFVLMHQILSKSDPSQHLKDKLVEIMEREPSNQAFEIMKEGHQDDLNYNFVLERKELRFHYACQYLHSYSEREYVKTVIDGCKKLRPLESVEVLKYLFQLHNAQGQPPYHVAFRAGFFGELLEFLPLGEVYKECVNAKDVRGWTALHCVVATDDYHLVEFLLKDEQVDVNAMITDEKSLAYSSMTALHLAILHNHVKSVKLLLQCPRTNVNVILYRDIVCGYERMRADDDENDAKGKIIFWSPLQLAAIMGLTDVTRALLVFKSNDIFDYGKFQNKSIPEEVEVNLISALLHASASGKPDTLRLFLDNEMFNPLVKFEEATALHYATNAMTPRARITSFDNCLMNNDFQVGQFLQFKDLGNLNCDPRKYMEEHKDIKLTPTSYLGRQACIIMLLQAGVDIWEKDNQNRFAEPGPQVSEDGLLWWHDRLAREIFDAKKSLHDVANAISVVAALVATASFVGPLQPPLGYGGDSMEGGVQDVHLSVRVFMVSNILSFYLAIASIMFAIVPSLPMPQEEIYAEWQRTRRSVGVAIFFLLMSVLGVLISFGTASNLVVSEDYSWQHAGLSFYPTLVGGFICILGISLFFIKLLRLVFCKNAKIRSLYKTFVKF